MRTRLLVLLLSLAATVLVAPLPADAQEDDHHDEEVPTTEFQGFPDGVGIGDFIYITGATVNPPEGGSEAPRELDDYQAAVFVQSWLACAFYCGPDAAVDPPADLPVYRVDTSGTWNGEPGTVSAYFATDGTTPYVAFPGVVVWTDPTQIPPPGSWFIPEERVIDAFNGEGELADTTGVETATSIPGSGEGTDEAAAAPDTDDDSSPAPLIAAGIGAAAIVVGGGLWLRRRRTPPAVE